MECNQGIIDLLLASVDLIEDLIGKVDLDTNKVSPVDTSVMAQMLQKVTEEGDASMIQLDRDGAAGESSVQGEQEAADAESAVSASEYDPEDVSLFQQTIKQQFEAVVVALDCCVRIRTRKT